MQDFYILCDICDDDLDLVAKLIQIHLIPHRKLSRIRTDMTYLRIAHYRPTITTLLDTPYKTIQLQIEQLNG
jgi:hypothetical protein